MLPETVEKMPWTADFAVKHEHPRTITVLDSSNGQDTEEAINAAFARVISICIERDIFHLFGGRHSEPFPLTGARYEKPVYMERFAAPLFGVTCRGAHLVAYRKDSKGELPEAMRIWVQRRSVHLYTYPGVLDNCVAGGVKSAASPLQTIVEEAEEEASLPADLVRRLVRSRGVVSHMSVTGRGFPGEQGLVVPDYIYVYDIELPPHIIPEPHDDEVQDFYCMNLQELQTALLQDEFKPDSAAVLIDFLIRHGVITPENERDFVEISMRLHRRLPFGTGPPR